MDFYKFYHWGPNVSKRDPQIPWISKFDQVDDSEISNPMEISDSLWDQAGEAVSYNTDDGIQEAAADWYLTALRWIFQSVDGTPSWRGYQKMIDTFKGRPVWLKDEIKEVVARLIDLSESQSQAIVSEMSRNHTFALATSVTRGSRQLIEADSFRLLALVRLVHGLNHYQCLDDGHQTCIVWMMMTWWELQEYNGGPTVNKVISGWADNPHRDGFPICVQNY